MFIRDIRSVSSRFRFFLRAVQLLSQFDLYMQDSDRLLLLRLSFAGPLNSASEGPVATASTNIAIVVGAASGGAAAVIVILGLSWRIYVIRKRKMLNPEDITIVPIAEKKAELDATLVSVVGDFDDNDAVFSNRQVWT
jgi:hypothetical protein